MVPHKLSKDKFDLLLILNCGPNEISNLKTNNHSHENKNMLKEKVYQSSEKIIRLASECLDKHPSLKKVVIVIGPPRNDSRNNAYLSEFANAILDDLWLKMGSPNKIVIGKQDLECEGDLKFQRFGNTN